MVEPEKFVKEKIEEIKKSVKGKAIIATSGGVDSSTAALLVNRAIGKSLVCAFVDTGFLRLDEPEAVEKALKGLGLNLTYVDARERFYTALKGITDTEQKRKIVGREFINVFNEVAAKQKVGYLVQGTIAPDWIESGGGLRDSIKSHHNVGGLPADMKLKIIEPLRDLYKDEVRKVGEYLGLPAEIHQKQPFPGPGLVVRILGEATAEKAEVLRKANAIVEGEIKKAVVNKEMEKPWQFFAVLLDSKAVGVQGDVRAYGQVIAVRAVQSKDGMSASYSKIPHAVLEKISTRITNELKDDVSRVVFDVTNKPPGTIEYE